jgi:hypothetical protein
VFKNGILVRNWSFAWNGTSEFVMVSKDSEHLVTKMEEKGKELNF